MTVRSRYVVDVGVPVSVGPTPTPDPQRRGHSRLAALVVVLSFLPYAALPTGSSTNVPLAGLAAVLFAREVVVRPRLFLPALTVVLAPLFVFFVQSLTSLGEGSEKALFLWALDVTTFGGAAAAVVVAAATVRRTLQVMLLVSAGYVAVQKVFLGFGVIPFVSLYDMPGYWSVPDNAEVIVEYIRRPFGWFPEPSFMAGTLALGAIALILLSHRELGRLTGWDVAAVAAVVGAVVLGESGSALLTVPVLGALVALPHASAARRAWSVAVGGALGAVMALQLLGARYETGNHSWDDRPSSIIAGLRHLGESASTFVAGVGPGGATVLFQDGAIPLDGLVVHERLFDIFSVTGRILLEYGVLGGGLVIAVLVVPVVRAFARYLGWSYGVLAALAWFAVSSLTITYSSAVWLWALPGVCLGVLVTDRPDPDALPDPDPLTGTERNGQRR